MKKYILFLFLLMMGVSNSSFAGEAFVSKGGEFRVPVKSFVDLRFKDTIRQKYDFSCGSAALATLLTYHYKRPVTEREVLTQMMEVGDKERIRKQGFSMLDMKNYLLFIGLRSNGYKQNLSALEDVAVPVIVLINQNGYMHFVVIKGLNEHEVLIGDPSRGLQSMARKDFEKIWNGIFFVIDDLTDIAKRNFLSDVAWSVREKARFDSAISSQSLASFSLNVTPTPGYY